MMLINGMIGKSLTGEQIKALVVPPGAEPAPGTDDIPARAAKALGVNIERILGPGCPDDKLMVIHLEAMLADPVAGRPVRYLATKYNIPENLMMEKLADVSRRFKSEPHLKLMVQKLQAEFESELAHLMVA